MKLKEIHTTATFAWSPSQAVPLIATGSVAGALDESFSNESKLEVWAPDFLDKDEYDLGEGHSGPKGTVIDSARFNRLAWGSVDSARPHGVIAAGMENGELSLWDPAKILANADPSESLILRNTTHTGPIRGLDFNTIQTNLLSSGGINGEVYVWDLKDPSKPYSPTPGARSSKLDEITSVAWNQQVPSVLAGASTTGYTVVWDLRGKREVVALAYGGGAGTLAGQGGTGSGLAVGGRRGMSDIAWHPDNATRLVTASEDDSSPIIMVWDLRNARAPEKILTGHDKGVLSLSWCKQDADLLLSCGKDNRALCWNPQTSEIIGELPSADNWAFQVDWCPRNPDMLAAAFFDGTIGIHSIQSTNEPITDASSSDAPISDGSDVFNVPGFSRSNNQGTLSLTQPPKWLRRPASSSFGFGGKLVTVSNLPSAQGKNQSSVVHIRDVVTESELVDRATKLQAAITEETLSAFAETKTAGAEAMSSAGWKALLSLFHANSRDELVTLLGFSKEEIAAKVAEAVATLKASADNATIREPSEMDFEEETPREPIVSFAEPERLEVSEDDDETTASEHTPSELSVSVTSDATRPTDGESTTTVPSLFGDDQGGVGTPQIDGGADFFSTMGVAQLDGLGPQIVPHHSYGIDSSVAATVGSGPSSVTSETMKSNTFRIYPNDESETDRLVTKALVLGDFESAVSLCLSSDRFADAILLAVKGGPELLQRTQKAYFERLTTTLPYLRLFQSIVTNDLADIVQNADLQEWQEIFVVLCTFASQEEFPGLAEQLGRRLEFQFTIAKGSDMDGSPERAQAFRKHATLTYLAAGRLERLVNIWIEELAEEEKLAIAHEDKEGSRYTAHAHALQTFIEKVTVFRSAIKYTDGDLSQTSSTEEAGAKTYKLAGLYDRYFEYADLLATQGLVKEAVAFLRLTPGDYQGSPGSGIDFAVGRDRLLASVRPSAPAPTAAVPALPATRAPATYGARGTGFTPHPVPNHTGYPQQSPAPVPVSNYPTYTGAPTPAQRPPQPPQPAQQQPAASVYAPAPSTYGGGYQPAQGQQQQQQSAQQSQQPSSWQPQRQPPPPSQVSSPYANPSAYQQQNNFQGQGPNTNSQGQGQNNNFQNQGQGNFQGGSQGQNGFQGGNQNPNGPPPRGNMPPLQPPPPRKTDAGGWNDAPPAASERRTPSALKLGAITSPFPNAAPSPMPTPGSPYMSHNQPATPLPPPPRPGSVARMQAPPRMPPPQRGPSTEPPVGFATPPQGQYAAPPSRGPTAGQTPPPNTYARPPVAQFAQGSPQQGPYGRATPPPQQQQQQQQQFASPPQGGPYGPGPQRGGPQGPPGPGGPGGPGGPPVPPPGRAPPTVSSARVPPKGPPPPKYPPGDRSHIPKDALPAFNIISQALDHLRQTAPPQQKRLVEDLDRRISPLFDALNCETLSKPVVDQLLVLVRAMEAHDREAALSIHVDLLTRGSQTDNIGLWMSGVKQLIMRL